MTVNVNYVPAVTVNVSPATSVSVVASGGIGPAGFLTVPGTSTQAFGTFQLAAGDGITVSTANGQFLISSYPSTTVSSLAPVQSVAGRTGTIVLAASDVTAGTFAIGRIPTIGYTALSGVPTAFAPASHTHDASDVASGTLLIARIPTISYTALSNTPTTFAPSAHTHSTTDVVAFTAAASAAAPVQSVQSRTGAIVLTRADITAAAEAHTHSTADVVGLTAAFSQVGHTHDAAAVTSGTLDITRIPVIGYTALSGVPALFAPSAHTHSTADVVAFTASASAAAPVQSVAGRTGAISLAVADVAGLASVAASGSYTSLSDVPATFAPITHTHSTSDITGYQGLPAQAGYLGPLVTDGTNSTWTSRYSIVSPVLVQGAGMTLTRDTSAGSITVAFAGGTSGLAVGSLAPLALGVAAAGSSANASREDHVHKLPTVGDITAAAASHTHDAAAVASGVLEIGRIPTIGYTALSGVPVSFTPSTHTHDAAAIASGTIDAARLPAGVSALNALTGGITIAAGANVTVSTASSTITIAAGGGTDSRFDLFLPPAPTGVTASAGNAQAVVSWTAPTVLAQTPITGYVVEWTPSGGSASTTSTGSTSTSYTKTGLTNGTAYTFRVAGASGIGTGAFSTASAAVTPVAGVTDPYFAQVALLLSMDGTDATFVDSSPTPKTITAFGNATQSTAQSKWGGKSAYFDGNGDYLRALGVPNIGTGDFVVEWWQRVADFSVQQSIIGTSTSGNLYVQFFPPYVNPTTIAVGRYQTGNDFTRSTAALSTNTWQYVAISRSGGVMRIYLNGSIVTGAGSSSISYSMGTIEIGANNSGSETPFNGYIDDLRITVGSDRGYTGSTIAVPTAAFPTS